MPDLLNELVRSGDSNQSTNVGHLRLDHERCGKYTVLDGVLVMDFHCYTLFLRPVRLATQLFHRRLIRRNKLYPKFPLSYRIDTLILLSGIYKSVLGPAGAWTAMRRGEMSKSPDAFCLVRRRVSYPRVIASKKLG